MLKNESVMLIGDKFPARVKWLQLYDSSESIEEKEMRELLIDVSQHITRNRIISGSARKFLDGKLIYYNRAHLRDQAADNKVFCIFTNELDIRKPVKAAVEEIALRGGVYSAKRFFEETIELLENPEKMRGQEQQLSTKEALDRIDAYNSESVDINELGYLISLLDRSTELDQMRLETIYFHVYESIQRLSAEFDSHEDPDEFLDAAYLIATRYQENNNFHLGLELYKQIIPIAVQNKRLDLEMACRIAIASIYKRYFPTNGNFILEILEPIEPSHLEETSNRQLEIYYCLLGHAFRELKDNAKALDFYERAIAEASQEINSPIWIAEAYNFLGDVERKKYFLKDAIRHYLTAAAIAFSAGDIPLADEFRHNSAKAEILISHSIMHSALVNHMEGNQKDSEYRCWDSLRVLIKSYMHCNMNELFYLEKLTEEILDHADKVLDIPGKSVRNMETIDLLRSVLKEFQAGTVIPGSEQETLEVISKEVEENIPIPPPTFLLLAVDGRLMTMGKITDDGWQETEIQGTLLSGVLSAIMSLITEVSDEVTSLRTVDAGNVQIMIEQSDYAVIALLVDRDIQEFRSRLIRLLDFINNILGDNLKFWDGNLDIFSPVRNQAIYLLAPSIVAANIDEYD